MQISNDLRWQHCIQHGFPVKNQHDNFTVQGNGVAVPGHSAAVQGRRIYAWTAFGPGPIRGEGVDPQAAVDDAILKTLGIIK